MGVHTFIDVGPPNDYYELLLVHSNQNEIEVGRVTLIPEISCFAPARIEFSQATLPVSMFEFLDRKDPCTIPEKRLQQEAKRKKRYLVFSGEDVEMQVQCQGKQKLIKAEILDRDLFDTRPNTPDSTAWTQKLLNKLNAALGASIWDKPMFSDESEGTDRGKTGPERMINDLKSGRFDALFPSPLDRPSVLYAQAQKKPATPTVELVSSEPFQPDVYVSPSYPPIAKAARVEGSVGFHFGIAERCVADSVQIDDGPRMLQPSVEEAVKRWRFCKAPIGQQIQARINFNLHCPPKKEH